MANKPKKISKLTYHRFNHFFYPARPKQVIKRARKIVYQEREFAPPRLLGTASSRNNAYIQWLKNRSMLHNSEKLAKQYSGRSKLWQNPYGKPRPRAAIDKASVWYTAYPVSTVKRSNESILKTLANDKLWDVFKEIGIKGMHTGPMKRAGGLTGWKVTPSIDGHFDRISSQIDPLFGTIADFKNLTQTAHSHNAIIIDDIVPAHTGKGPDFRLAEMNYHDYPGIFHMVEVSEKDWKFLPKVPKGKDSVNIDSKTEKKLKELGYIVGELQRVIFYEPGVKETNWSVTGIVRGTDGVRRRWVYLHYFKEGQPSINWLDPSFAGMKLVIGDALQSLGELGSTGIRLDANGFLGIEPGELDSPAWSEGHPLAASANEFIASMVRKLGGFTFQELNLTMDDIKIMGEGGADLSYDFINRPAYHHAIATGDTEFLRLCLNLSLELGIDSASLVHAMQNHDELTYELVHFWTAHKDDLFEFRSKMLIGLEVRELIRDDLKNKLSGTNAPYNLLFGQNGIACTSATVVAGALGYSDLSKLSLQDVNMIRDGHLLMAMFNALQPGVYALSGWDLSGALTLNKEDVKHLLEDGDTRWINRGAYNLLGDVDNPTESNMGMPMAPALYESLPDQLKDENSFASKLKHILHIRDLIGLAKATQLEIPSAPLSDKSILIMVHKLPDETIQATVLNFSNQEVNTEVTSYYFETGQEVRDALTGDIFPSVDENKKTTVTVPAFGGLCLVFK